MATDDVKPSGASATAFPTVSGGLVADAQASFCATLVDQLVADGVTRAFIAPGSRSTPMAVAIARCRSIEFVVTVDERSAGFAALGAGLASGRPAIALCTSGTAATHFHAAVVEADLSGVPLIVITADRPPELRDVAAPQTIDQTKLFGSSVRWFHDPGVPGWDSSPTWRSLARRVAWSTTGRNPGPVHLNLPFREPLLGEAVLSGAPTAPSTQVIGAGVERNSLDGVVAMVSAHRGVLVVGRGGPSRGSVERLATRLGWPVFAEPRSGCSGSGSAVAHFDAVLRVVGDNADFRPDVVIRFGEAPASKVLAQWVTASQARQIHVTSRSRFHDSDHAVGTRIEADVESVAQHLVDAVNRADESWADRWRTVSAAAGASVAATLEPSDAATPIAVARRLAATIPTGGHLVVSSSMPIRNLEWFGGDTDHLTVHSNRGANGIDGVVATAIGVASASGRPTTVLLGDIALIHDLSSVASLARIGLPVTLVVCDNDGGGIFEFLPQANQLGRPEFEALFGTPHGLDLSGVLSALGLPTSTAASLGDVEVALRSPGPAAIVVRSRRSDDVDEHRRLQDAVREAVTRELTA